MDNREALLKEKIALVAKNLAEPVKANEFINKFVKNLGWWSKNDNCLFIIYLKYSYSRK